MDDKMVVIIGGGAGGATAAARLRRLNEDCEIVLIEKGQYVSSATCGLPYHVGDLIKEESKLQILTPPTFLHRFAVEVRTESEAISIDRENKQVEVFNRKNEKTYKVKYDDLILAPGANPIEPNIKGIDQADIFSLRTISDSIRIKDYIKNNNLKKAVIVGAGYIGLEMAENLKHLGIDIVLIEMQDQVMPLLDFEIAQFIHKELADNGVNLILNEKVESFKKDGDKNITVTSSGQEIESDIIILSLGITPDTKLARDCGLKLNSSGHIVVDSTMKTSDPNIYAVGDAIEIEHFITGEKINLPLGGPANRQGRIAADNIAGRKSEYKGAVCTSIVKVFNRNVASVGLTEKYLKQSGKYNFEKIYSHSDHHAGYYPGSQLITIKLLFSKDDGKILGAQIAGGDGVDKRIDIIATMILNNAAVHDLIDLELAYAPPFGSAKDPVNIAGMVAANYLSGDMPIVHWHEMDELIKKGSFLLDIRRQEEYDRGHIEDALRIEETEIRYRLDDVPFDKPIITYCELGYRGYLGTRLLLQSEYEDVRNLSGGYFLYSIATWKK